MSSFKIPTNSLLLVTGANGFAGSHVVDQCLAAGYRVRGTVRDTARCQWMAPFFSSRYGPGRFELVEIKDFADPKTYGSALQDVAGIAHTAAPSSPAAITDRDEAIDGGIKGAVSMLEAAREQKSVKAFVLTSSEWAAFAPQVGVEVKVGVDDYNEGAVAMAYDGNEYPPMMSKMLAYTAMKTKTEQAAWEWVKREKPAFTFNTVLPAAAFGTVLSPLNQGIPSTAGFVKLLWEGQQLDLLKMIPPQLYVSVEDQARLHLAGLILPGVDGERIFAMAGHYNWNLVLDIFKKLYPEKAADFVTLPDLGMCKAEVPNQRAEELLKQLGHKGWMSLEEAIREDVESFLATA